VPYEPDDHNDYRYKKHEKGYPVHAMHEFQINISRCVSISFFDVEVGKYLLPDALFHFMADFRIKLRRLTKAIIFALRFQQMGN